MSQYHRFNVTALVIARKSPPSAGGLRVGVNGGVGERYLQQAAHRAMGERLGGT